MKTKDEILIHNKLWWEKMVKEKCGFTLPWLDLSLQDILGYIDNPQGTQYKRLQTMFPVEVFSKIDGKEVLCLASGGGQ
jgi:hypothetical protein